ncbi:heavy metal sensor histidine kinase [Steroidobacter sp. S1-65]|uniref:Sensor protein n=1 Tax=Steroidobacter gossypii TaxID=2805490 RepID=A0ABS1WRM7_9GAMM|nr:heavy metal sensor histidine kinase [Steroidobacter gossypii]MBM0103611.1 heavy metal sensor histidine kinase [Steroidobacter gossypii]
MKLSISQRLAAMFAVASFVTLAVLGVAMHGLLKRELGRHQDNELQARWQMYRPFIMRNDEAAYWGHIRSKFDNSLSENSRVRVWVLSDDRRFRYGSELTAEQLRSAVTASFGQVRLPDQQEPFKTYSAMVEARGERPAVRLMVGIDSTPFVETLQSFTVGLVALTIVGALGAAALGYYIAGVGLRPVERLSGEAQALSPGRLSRRLQTDTLAPELSKLADSFNGALARLEAAYQQLEAFNADVAHELRTPLGNLIGQTQVTLSRERSVTELKEALHSNLEDLERLRAIVNDMLFLARADRGERAPNRIEVSIAQEVAHAVEYLEFIFEEAGVRVRIEGDAQASIETSLFRRAVTNLLQNAVQHAPRGAEIVVSVLQQPGAIRVSVRNTGSGIAREHLSRLFDRFYRVDSSRSGSRENHGLGLAIVRAVATMHGGTVFAESDDGATTIGFTVACA